MPKSRPIGHEPIFKPFLAALSAATARINRFCMTDSLPCLRRPVRRALRNFFSLFLVISCSAFANGPAPAGADEETVRLFQLRENIIDYAKGFMGLPYRHGGVTPRTGFDCSGFTSFILREFNVRVSSCASAQSVQGRPVDLDDVKPGDLLFFGRRRGIQHVALVVEKRPDGIYCVHSTCSRGIIVENVSTSRYWKPRIRFARDVVAPQAELYCLI